MRRIIKRELKKLQGEIDNLRIKRIKKTSKK